MDGGFAGGDTLEIGRVIPGIDAKGRSVRVCPKCGVEKPSTADHFPTRIGRGKRRGQRILTSWCRPCNSAARSAEGKVKNRLRRYGISIEQFDALKAGGSCPICANQYVDKRHHARQPVVDHDHVTGRVRGVICRSCNLGLGYANDDPEWLDSASFYLVYGMAPRNVTARPVEIVP